MNKNVFYYRANGLWKIYGFRFADKIIKKMRPSLWKCIPKNDCFRERGYAR